MPDLLTRVDEGERMGNKCSIHKVIDNCTIDVEHTTIALADFSLLGPPSLEPEHARLKDEVVEAAKAECELERLGFEGKNTTIRTDALINLSRAARVRRAAVDALIAFEAEHKIGGKLGSY